MSFHYVNIILEQGRFNTSVYRKPILSAIYTHFDSFLPPSNKIGLLYRCFWISSDWTKFHLELIKLIDVFKSNGYPDNFINNCFKVFVDNKYTIQTKVITVPKKTLVLVLPYLGPLSLATRTTLRKPLKGILNCCKLQIVFKTQNKWAKAFRFKDRIPKELTSGALINFSVGSAMNLVMANVLDTLMWELESISESHHWLRRKLSLRVVLLAIICNNSSSFENVSVLNKENQKFVLGLKEILLVMRGKPSYLL